MALPQTQTITTEHYNRMPYVALTVTENSVNTQNNTSNITYSVVFHCPGSYSPTATKTITWTVGSETGSWSGKLTGGSNYTMTIKSSTTVNLAHDDDGKKTISLACSFTLNTSWDGVSYSTLYGSGTMVLNPISRYATCTQSMSSKTETTIKMNWSSDSTIESVWYSKNGGSSWTSAGSVNATSGSYTISGLTANTAYSIKTKVRKKGTTLDTESTALSVTTYAYPYCTSAPNFTIGDKLTIGLYNPLGRSVTITMVGADNTERGTDTTTGTSKAGYYDTGWVNWWYSTIPSAKSGTYKVKVIYGSNTATKTGGTYTVNTSVCAPAITGITYADTNETTFAKTGDSSKIIQNKSTVQYTASGVSAKNSATVSTVKVAVNGSTYTLSKSGTNYIGGNAAINSGTDVTATCTVTDSRGLTASKSVTVTMLAYSNPSATVTFKRQYGFYAETTLKADATYSYINGGNSVTMTYVCVATPRSGETTPANVSGSLTNGTAVTVTLDNNFAWTVTVTVTDALGSPGTVTKKISRGVPLIMFDRLRNSIGLGSIPAANNTVEVGPDMQVRALDPTGGTPFYVDQGLANKNSFFSARRRDTGYLVSFGVGSGGTNRGIYAFSNTSAGFNGNWMLYMGSALDRVFVPWILEAKTLTSPIGNGTAQSYVQIVPMWNNAALGLTSSTSNPKSYMNAWTQKVIETYGAPSVDTIYIGTTQANSRGFAIWRPYPTTTADPYQGNVPKYGTGLYVMYSHGIYTISHESYTLRMWTPTMTEYTP